MTLSVNFYLFMEYPFLFHGKMIWSILKKFQERDISEESGWKSVHGDVFRPPRYLILLTAVVGIGAQLATLVLVVMLLAIVGMLYVG